MKKHLILLALFFSSMMASAQVEKILGEWRTVDDVTGETKGIVEFYQDDNGLYYGKILKVFRKGQVTRIFHPRIPARSQAREQTHLP